MPTNTCPSCNAPIDAGARFCPNCGQPIQAALSAATTQPFSNVAQGKPKWAIFGIVAIIIGLIIAIACPFVQKSAYEEDLVSFTRGSGISESTARQLSRSFAEHDKPGQSATIFAVLACLIGIPAIIWLAKRKPTGAAKMLEHSAASDTGRKSPQLAIWVIVGAAAALVIAIAIPSIRPKKTEEKSAGNWPRANYAPSQNAYEDARETEFKRSAKDLNAYGAKGNALAEKFNAQMEAVDSAASPEEKIRAIDDLLATCESLLELSRDIVGLLEADQKAGHVSLAGISEDELRHTLSAAQDTIKTLTNKMSDLKREKAALEAERKNP